MQIKLPFGMKDGVLVHIDDVPRGLACECVCPSCGVRLIARKGKLTTNHFAHYQKEVCKNAFETTLHLVAKEILEKHKKIIVPKVEMAFAGTENSWLISQAKEIKFGSVKLEKYHNGVIPDVFVSVNYKPLMIEITVTHKTSIEKIDKVRRQGISMLEIDLSSYDRNLIFEKLEHAVIKDVKNKNWLLNVLVEEYEGIVKEHNIGRTINCRNIVPNSSRGMAQRIKELACPKERGGAVSFEVCKNCSYCLGRGSERVLCSFNDKISNYKDFRKYCKLGRKKYFEGLADSNVIQKVRQSQMKLF